MKKVMWRLQEGCFGLKERKAQRSWGWHDRERAWRWGLVWLGPGLATCREGAGNEGIGGVTMIHALGHDKVCGSHSEGMVRPRVGFDQRVTRPEICFHMSIPEDIFYGGKGRSSLQLGGYWNAPARGDGGLDPGGCVGEKKRSQGQHQSLCWEQLEGGSCHFRMWEDSGRNR